MNMRNETASWCPSHLMTLWGLQGEKWKPTGQWPEQASSRAEGGKRWGPWKWWHQTFPRMGLAGPSAGHWCSGQGQQNCRGQDKVYKQQGRLSGTFLDNWLCLPTGPPAMPRQAWPDMLQPVWSLVWGGREAGWQQAGDFVIRPPFWFRPSFVWIPDAQLREPSEAMAKVVAAATWPTGGLRSNGSWRARAPGWAPVLTRAIQPPSMSLAGNELVPIPTLPHTLCHQTGLGSSEGHWAHIKGFLWQQEALESPKASHSSVFSSQSTTLVFYCSLPPCPKGSLFLLVHTAWHPVHSPLIPSPSRWWQDTGLTLRGTQDHHALPFGEAAAEGLCGELKKGLKETGV